MYKGKCERMSTGKQRAVRRKPSSPAADYDSGQKQQQQQTYQYTSCRIGWSKIHAPHGIDVAGCVVVLLLLASSSFSGLKSASAATVASFQVGVVSSMTGNLTDWNDTVAGYQFWISRINSLYPTGLPVKDMYNNVYKVGINLTVVDDASDEKTHTSLVTQMVTSGGVDFVMNANPSFAASEAAIVSRAKKVNIHATTGNSNVFKAQLPGVFGIAASSEYYLTSLFQTYKVSNIRTIVFVKRSDNVELAAACDQAVLVAKLNLISYIEIPYKGSDDILSIASQVNSSASVDALVGCMTSAEAMVMYKVLDTMQKPIKNLFFINGPGNATWNTEMGYLAQYLTAPADWSPTLSNAQDELFGSTQAYAVSFSSWAGVSAATNHNAGASAAGYCLSHALMTAFQACDLTNTKGDATLLLYGTLNCTDNRNNGIQRISYAIQADSLTTFYGGIAFDKYGQNYQAVASVIQVFPQTQDLKVINAPSVVMPASRATKAIVIPQPNLYTPDCLPGTFQNPDPYLPCLKCPAGYYQDASGRSSCVICGNNVFSDKDGSSSCQACPSNSITFNKGSVHISDCLCQVGFYNEQKLGGYACSACPGNANCAGGEDWPRPEYGWYTEIGAPFRMFNCNPNLFCAGNYTCAPGYTKRMCAYCDTSDPDNLYFMTMNRCYPCPNSGVIYIGLAIMFVAFIWLNIAVTRSIEVFHVVMTFCQLLSLIANFNTNWPDQVSTVMNFATVLSFETDVLQPQCMNRSWDFENNLVLQLLMPIGMLLIVLVWTGFTYLGYRIKMLVSSGEEPNAPSSTMKLKTSSSVGSELEITRSDASNISGVQRSSRSFSAATASQMRAIGGSSFFLILQNLFQLPDDRGEMMEVVYERMALPILFLDVSYVVSLKYCLSALFCYDFMGVKYVYYMPEEVCYSGKHWKLIMIAVAGLSVYIVGYWIFVVTTLRHLKRTGGFAEKVPLLLFGWIYDKYQAQWYWYNIVSLAQRTIYTVVTIFMLAYPDIQLLIVFLVGSAVMVVDVRSAAFMDLTCNYMSNLSEVVLLIITIIGLMLYNPLTLSSTIDAFSTICLILIIGYLCIGGFLIVLEGFFMGYISILKRRHGAIAKKWGHHVKRYRHMYHFFSPWFMFRWLSKAKVHDWQDWHKLCVMLVDYAHPTSEVSYLSCKKVGRFWRYMLQSFPETVDYLASVDEHHREAFSEYIETMYEHFFESNEQVKHQLNHIVSDKFQAPFAQFLAAAEDKEIEFVNKVMKSAFEKARGKEASRDLSHALERSRTCMKNLSPKASDPIAGGSDDGISYNLMKESGLSSEGKESAYSYDTGHKGGIKAIKSPFSYTATHSSSNLQDMKHKVPEIYIEGEGAADHSLLPFPSVIPGATSHTNSVIMLSAPEEEQPLPRIMPSPGQPSLNPLDTLEAELMNEAASLHKRGPGNSTVPAWSSIEELLELDRDVPVGQAEEISSAPKASSKSPQSSSTITQEIQEIQAAADAPAAVRPPSRPMSRPGPLPQEKSDLMMMDVDSMIEEITIDGKGGSA